MIGLDKQRRGEGKGRGGERKKGRRGALPGGAQWIECRPGDPVNSG